MRTPKQFEELLRRAGRTGELKKSSGIGYSIFHRTPYRGGANPVRLLEPENRPSQMGYSGTSTLITFSRQSAKFLAVFRIAKVS